MSGTPFSINSIGTGNFDTDVSVRKLIVKGVDSQTTSLLNIQMSNGDDRLTVDNNGDTTVDDLTAIKAKIESGNIDNTVIGETAAAAGTFTSINANNLHIYETDGTAADATQGTIVLEHDNS